MAESGTHDTLMAWEGLYFDLVTAQVTDGQIETPPLRRKLTRSAGSFKRRRTGSLNRNPSLVRQLSKMVGMDYTEVDTGVEVQLSSAVEEIDGGLSRTEVSQLSMRTLLQYWNWEFSYHLVTD